MAPVPVPLLPLLTLLASAGASAPAIDVGDIPRGPDACPSRAQIADALEAHMPGVLARVGRELDPNVLHLGLAISAAGVAHVTLTDATGALQLERDLDLPRPPPAAPSAPPRDHSADCAAFADTLSLIVERYMRHLGYPEPPPPALVPRPEPPPPPPPPAPPPSSPRALVGLGLGARPGWGGPARVEPGAVVDVRVGAWSVAASGTYAVPRSTSIAMSAGAGEFTFSAVSGRLALGRVVPVGPGLALVPALGGGVDVVLAHTTGIDRTRKSSAVEPVVEAGASLFWLPTAHFWLGARLQGGLDLRPEEFFVTTDASPTPVTLLMTPRGYVRVGVDFGVSFGKN
jgi:hypothetical protein